MCATIICVGRLNVDISSADSTCKRFQIQIDYRFATIFWQDQSARKVATAVFTIAACAKGARDISRYRQEQHFTIQTLISTTKTSVLKLRSTSI